LTDFYDLINIGTGQPSDKVTVHSFSKEEVDGTDKFNYATNTLDKDSETVWAADDGAILGGDYKGDGEYIIYDLSSIHTLGLIQFSTTNKSDAFGFQIMASTTGTADSDFSVILPTSGDLIFTTTNTTDFNQYEVSNTEARYIKLIGYGRYNSHGDTRTSVWSAVGEIEFYGNKPVSVKEDKLADRPVVYPVPAKDILHLKNLSQVTSLSIFNMNGQKVVGRKITASAIDVNVSTITNGSYILVMKGDQIHHTCRIVITH